MMYMKVRLGNYIKEYSKKNKADEDIPVYSVTNTQGFCRDYFGKEVASKDKTTYKIVPQGCFAYNPSRINVGSVDWQRDEERVIVSPLYNVFSVSEELDQEYLYYYLKSDFALQRIRAVATGSVRDNLKLEMLKEFPILLPPKNDQKTIANNLDRVKRVIELRKSEIDKMDDLIKARFVEMFGDINVKWKEVTMTDICKDMRTGPFGSALHHDEFVDKGIFVLGIDNAVENKFSYNRMRYITEEKYEKLKRYTVHPGDVIITIMGTVGRSAVVPKDMPKAINTKHLACLTPDTNMVDSYFLVNAFQIHPLIRHQLESQSKGAIMNGLNLTIIKGLKFRLPPLELQKEFVDFYNQVDKSKVAVQKALEKTQLLFDSLMQQYFG